MPEPVYSVKFYYGDMKFTNDYSNVLHFNSKESRDSYFDSFDTSFEIVNTELNRVMFDGGSIKVAISISDLSNIDKINYCYINYALLDGNNFEQYRKYYFVNSYDIVSSNENVTVVEFNIEYDVWQNNQFDFTFRESNVERMHVDRWEVDRDFIKYKRPILDAIESNATSDLSLFHQIEENTVLSVKLPNDTTRDCNVIWVMVTALHTFSDSIDQLLYHFIPVLYKNYDMTFNIDDPEQPEYYFQNSIKMGNKDALNIYFPSLQALDSTYLAYACGNGADGDVVKIINVQFFNWLPLELTYESVSPFTGAGAVIRLKAPQFSNIKFKLYGNTPIFPSMQSVGMFASYAVADLTVFKKSLGFLTKSTYFTDFSKPEKPIDGVDYDKKYEPALYMSPVIKRYIVMGDISAMSEIPDAIFINNIFNKTNKRITLSNRISFSALSAYSYYTLGTDRVIDNAKGFAMIKPSLFGDIISDAWQDYVVQQRDSDRAMMWTNIATGGITELGSTTVSAGIGWRSNMERAYTMGYSEKFAKSQQRYYNNTPGAGHAERAQFYKNLRDKQLKPNIAMYGGMARNAMMMSGIGGVTAFSANAIHQAMAQNTKERAIQNTPGNLAKSGNAIASIIDEQFNLFYVETIVDETSFEKYRILFMKYGYYIGGVELPNINSRKYFNYIKTNGAILTGSCNNLILSYLASIFDNGVTIWHMDYTTYNTLYNYEKENIERSLM